MSTVIAVSTRMRGWYHYFIPPNRRTDRGVQAKILTKKLSILPYFATLQHKDFQSIQAKPIIFLWHVNLMPWIRPPSKMWVWRGRGETECAPASLLTSHKTDRYMLSSQSPQTFIYDHYQCSEVTYAKRWQTYIMPKVLSASCLFRTNLWK